MDAQERVVAEQERPDIKTGSGFGGHPVGVQRDQRVHRLQERFLRNLRQTDAFRRTVQTAGVLLGPEQLDPPLGGAVRLHALEDLGAVVEHRGGGMQGKISKGNDACILPFLPVIIHQEHMIGKVLAESKLRCLRLFFRSSRFRDLDLHDDILSAGRAPAACRVLPVPRRAGQELYNKTK